MEFSVRLQTLPCDGSRTQTAVSPHLFLRRRDGPVRVARSSHEPRRGPPARRRNCAPLGGRALRDEHRWAGELRWGTGESSFRIMQYRPRCSSVLSRLGFPCGYGRSVAHSQRTASLAVRDYFLAGPRVGGGTEDNCGRCRLHITH